MASRARALSALSVVLGLAALMQAASALYIPAKAALAQMLLQQAWARTLDGEREARPWAWADTWPVARLRAEALDANFVVLSGVDGSSLAFAPGHDPASVAPGEIGNSVIAAHRDTHFRFLRSLRPGDRLQVDLPGAVTLEFEVAHTFVADLRRERLRLDADTPRLSLVTCYPFEALSAGGPERYVVDAVLVSPADTPKTASFVATADLPAS